MLFLLIASIAPSSSSTLPTPTAEGYLRVAGFQEKPFFDSLFHFTAQFSDAPLMVMVLCLWIYSTTTCDEFLPLKEVLFLFPLWQDSTETAGMLFFSAVYDYVLMLTSMLLQIPMSPSIVMNSMHLSAVSEPAEKGSAPADTADRPKLGQFSEDCAGASAERSEYFGAFQENEDVGAGEKDLSLRTEGGSSA